MLITLLLITSLYTPCTSFLLNVPNNVGFSLQPPSTRLQQDTVPDHNNRSPTTTTTSGGGGDDDAQLLRSVTKQELVDLCQQMGITDVKGTKANLLQRLREHAAAQLESQRAVRRDRVQRVEEDGCGDNPKERYELVTSPLDEEQNYDDDVDVEEEDEDFIFYHAPNAFSEKKESNERVQEETEEEEPSQQARNNKAPAYLSQAAVTAPPLPPDAQPNEQGERVVQVYSTKDQNDLTGVAAAQPGQAALSTDALTNAASSSSSSQPQPWDPQSNQRSTSNQETQRAEEEIIELVRSLLSMTGLPAFYLDDDDDDHDEPSPPRPRPTALTYTGFDPTRVPTDLLTSSSTALRTGRGASLEDVLRQFEMQAIGQDGLHGDKVDAGGGHYREVAKVRAFLEGYRRAEVRRIARETTTLLLDKLILEGVPELDATLSTMTRSGDDTSEHGGELNDSLLEYLNDAIRQQEKKVDRLVAARLETTTTTPSARPHLGTAQGDDEEDDALDRLWNVTTTEDGQRVESLDPNDPKVKTAVEDELIRQEIAETLASQTQKETSSSSSKPESAPEQLLLLLTLLRERIKAEAVFIPDEKGRNLRLLAYCLQTKGDSERKQLFSRDLGNSMDVSGGRRRECMERQVKLMFFPFLPHTTHTLFWHSASIPSSNWCPVPWNTVRALPINCSRPRRKSP